MASLRKIVFFILFATAFLVGCDEFGGESGGGSGGDTKGDTLVLPNIKPFIKGDTVSRTLLVYIMAENDISDYLQADFNEIKNGAYCLSDDVRLFVYFDNSDTEHLPALYQYHPYNGDLVENIVYTFVEDVCSSDTAVLGKVLDLVFKDYPTKAFDLVMGSHAYGWIPYGKKSAPSRYIGVDNGNNSDSYETVRTIEVDELAELLERLPLKVDRLMFDACLMQGVEVAYALRNTAEWVIGSPAEIPAYGAPYATVVPEFFDPSSGVEDIMYEYKLAYDNLSYATLLSAVRTSCLQELADVTGGFVKKYFGASVVNDYSSCLAYVPGKAPEYPAYYDLNSVMEKFLEASDYEVWKEAFDKAVPYAMVSNSETVWAGLANKVITITDDFGAVSAYFPQNKSVNAALNEKFRATEWYGAAGWSEAGW